MRRMNYNPFETPFASGKLANFGGSPLNDFKFVLDNPLKEGVYLFEIIENDIPDYLDDYVYTGVFKFYNSNSQSSEFYGQAGDYRILLTGNYNSEDKALQELKVDLLNNYEIDLSSFSYTIKFYKIA